MWQGPNLEDRTRGELSHGAMVTSYYTFGAGDDFCFTALGCILLSLPFELDKFDR
jgi:hypothetical protein